MSSGAFGHRTLKGSGNSLGRLAWTRNAWLLWGENSSELAHEEGPCPASPGMTVSTRNASSLGCWHPCHRTALDKACLPVPQGSLRLDGHTLPGPPPPADPSVCSAPETTLPPERGRLSLLPGPWGWPGCNAMLAWLPPTPGEEAFSVFRDPQTKWLKITVTSKKLAFNQTLGC